MNEFEALVNDCLDVIGRNPNAEQKTISARPEYEAGVRRTVQSSQGSK